MKKRFLQDMALSNTQSSSFQHANVYADNISLDRRKSFVQEFRHKLEGLEKIYGQTVSSEQHPKNIEGFADSLTNSFPDVLYEKKMRIGIAQKAVNLYLKYMWCFGWIPEPPHCPIDRTVLEAVDDQDDWTKMDGIRNYSEKIRKIELKKGDKSFSEWECELFNNRANEEN